MRMYLPDALMNLFIIIEALVHPLNDCHGPLLTRLFFYSSGTPA